jgi:hypothetical protein
MSELKILAVGDISLQTAENPFKKLKSVLSSGDILIGNLETALTDCRDDTQKSVAISSKPWKGEFLKEAGFDILNIANNHIMDRGPLGLEDTLSALERMGLHAIGAAAFGGKSSVILNRKGRAIGFLGYDQYGYNKNGYSVNALNLDKTTLEISVLRSKCDIIIVSLHWGIENVHYPSPDQIKLAHAIIDAGANILLGHHPHVLQGIEEYNGGLIAYSLGNFQFDPSISGASYASEYGTDRSIILSLKIGEGRSIFYEIVPVIIDGDYHPQSADRSLNAGAFIADISRPISANTINWKWWFNEISKIYLEDSIRSWKKRIRRYGFTHLIQCCRWLVSPFVLRCLFSIIRRSLQAEKPAVDDNGAALSSKLTAPSQNVGAMVNEKL